MKEAIPLPISKLDEKQRESTKDYCTNTEFKCYLDGGDPAATIYNLRAMAFSSGFEKGVKWLIEEAKNKKQNCMYLGEDGLQEATEKDMVMIDDLTALVGKH